MIIHNWRNVLRSAWSVRLMAIASILSDIIAELRTPSGQSGPLQAAYARGAGVFGILNTSAAAAALLDMFADWLQHQVELALDWIERQRGDE